MYIDENNPKYIFDDIFALLLHFNEYTSLQYLLKKKEEDKRQDTQQAKRRRKSNVFPVKMVKENLQNRKFILKWNFFLKPHNVNAWHDENPARHVRSSSLPCVLDRQSIIFQFTFIIYLSKFLKVSYKNKQYNFQFKENMIVKQKTKTL